MNVIGTQEFCLCRQPVTPGTNQCADQCRTYMSTYGKQFWTIKVRGFRFYLDTRQYVSRIRITSVKSSSYNFHVNIPIPQKYVQSGFISVFGKSLADFITSEFLTLQTKNTDVPISIAQYRFSYWLEQPPIDFIVLNLSAEVLTKYAYYMHEMNFGLELEISNLDKATPWIEKL
ncbi:MAG: hypothetical protein V3U54_13250 [Thermodesulfobacteriota bacterium]